MLVLVLLVLPVLLTAIPTTPLPSLNPLLASPRLTLAFSRVPSPPDPLPPLSSPFVPSAVEKLPARCTMPGRGPRAPPPAAVCTSRTLRRKRPARGKLSLARRLDQLSQVPAILQLPSCYTLHRLAFPLHASAGPFILILLAALLPTLRSFSAPGERSPQPHGP